MKNIFVPLAIALVAGIPVGWIAAMSLTPVLWRLEPVLGMELAGHSGPSDWVILLISALVVAALFAVVQRRWFR